MRPPEDGDADRAGPALQDTADEQQPITALVDEPCKPHPLAERVGYLEEALCDLRDAELDRDTRPARRLDRNPGPLPLTERELAAMQLVQHHLSCMHSDANEANRIIAQEKLNIRFVSESQVCMVAGDIDQALFNHDLAVERLGLRARKGGL